MKKLKMLMALAGLMVGASVAADAYARSRSCVLFDCHYIGSVGGVHYYNCARYCW